MNFIIAVRLIKLQICNHLHIQNQKQKSRRAQPAPPSAGTAGYHTTGTLPRHLINPLQKINHRIPLRQPQAGFPPQLFYQQADPGIKKKRDSPDPRKSARRKLYLFFTELYFIK